MRNRSYRPRLEVMDLRITPSDIAPIAVAVQAAPPTQAPVAQDLTTLPGIGPPGGHPYWVDPTPMPCPLAPAPVYWAN